MTQDLLHKKVKINANDKTAIIVWYADDYIQNPESDCFLLDLMYENELPKFYKRGDFEIIK